MIVPVMAISNLVLTRQIYSEETNGAHAHNRDRVPFRGGFLELSYGLLPVQVAILTRASRLFAHSVMDV